MIPRILLLTFAVCLVPGAAVGADAAGDFTIPQAWEGVWNLTNTHRPCGTTGGMVEMEADTLCAGTPIYESEEGQPPPDCTGTVTDTEVNIVCTYVVDIEGIPGCTATITITAQATRTGETYTAVETIAFDYTPECGIPDSCEETVTTGVRTGEDPNCAPSPVEPSRWSRIKSRYR